MRQRSQRADDEANRPGSTMRLISMPCSLTDTVVSSAGDDLMGNLERRPARPPFCYRILRPRDHLEVFSPFFQCNVFGRSPSEKPDSTTSAFVTVFPGFRQR